MIDKDTNMDELEKEKQKYLKCGFRIGLIDNTTENNNLEENLLSIIRNHINK
jgi:uncharacterized protein YbbC (DUF1343 family)